jgi:predicted nicotinamide N-methyase
MPDGEAAPASAAASTAIVPYTLANPFADGLRLPSRTVALGGHTWTLTQHWEPDGRGGTALGFGASVYGGSIVLAHYVLTHAADFGGGAAVIELGAGLGLGSLAVAAVGGRPVATDGDDLVVGYARANLDANGCGGVPAVRLLWGDADDAARVLEVAAATAAASSGGRVAAVIAADVVAAPYAEHFPGLVGTLAALCGATGAPFLLAYQRRSGEDDAFFAGMASAGFTACQLPPEEAVHPDFRGELRPLSVWRFVLPPSQPPPPPPSVAEAAGGANAAADT